VDPRADLDILEKTKFLASQFFGCPASILVTVLTEGMVVKFGLENHYVVDICSVMQ
jgi:hypothetical protein